MTPIPLLRTLRRLPRTAWMLPAAALAAVVIFVINESAYERSSTSLGALAEQAAAAGQVQLVWRSLIDAETGQRGYLLTGRDDYLEPYRLGTGQAADALGWLTQHYADDPAASPIVAEMRAFSEGKLSELATTLELHRQGRNDAWRELMLTDIGREKMEGLRDASSRLLDLETQRVAAERRSVVATLRSGRIGVSTMTVLGLLALFVFLRRSIAVERARRDNAAVVQSERDRLEIEAARRTDDLASLTRHLHTAREDERSRLARELHDELGALLTAAKLDAARLKRAIGAMSPEVQSRLVHLNESINRGIELKRKIIEELRPSSLSNLGLVAAIEILARDHSGGDLEVGVDLETVELTDSAQITAYRMVQEALANTAHHARAAGVTVELHKAFRDGRPGADLAIVDDGVGFDPDARRGTTHGLMGLRYRVEAEGGELRVVSRPGDGTRVEAWFPTVVAAAAADAPVTAADDLPSAVG